MANRALESLIDTHCHLDFAEFNADLSTQLNLATLQGVSAWVVPGVTLKQSEQLLTFKQQHANVGIAFGLHPYFLALHDDSHMTQLATLARTERANIVAIGECGIDANIVDIPRQQDLFAAHIRLANELALPLIVHHRQSHHLLAAVFKQHPPQFGGVIHAFSGSMQQAEAYLKLGFKLGIGGTISYPRAVKTRTVVAALPLSALVLETDAPAMPLAGFQGQRNSPVQLRLVFEQLCALRNESAHEIAQALSCNTHSVFGPL
ncbi:TatD family hydrolase [Pseudoalteromonas fenneropenaei]|uniref:TatD family hydrolase n=1 Tax=Pseudoalteromonas fenneropenaei TaxID=1737459 RepID=A0ABV7CHD4_9GAMM